MTKKDQDLVKELLIIQSPTKLKKSKSTGSLKVNQKDKQIQELKDQVKFEANKAQNYLIQLTKLTVEVDSKEQEIKELTSEKDKLTNQNIELRINNLKQKDYFTKYQAESKFTQQLKLQISKLQKDLTIAQQDLKSAQRIIELRTLKPNNEKVSPFGY